MRAKPILRYMLLPNIIPQIKQLFGSGFSYFAYLIASVFASVRILPNNHPYVSPANIGKYSIRAVIAQAANHITLSRDNWDQILIFIAVLAGIVLLVAQFVALIFLAFVGDAFAGNLSGPASGAGMFDTVAPDKDVAFQLLDYTFGIPDFFGSNAITGSTPTPFHSALHQMFLFYNTAILVVAVLVFIYYVIVVVAETAQTGTPFGKRFAHIYAPIRLVIAIGLLIPLAHGFNTAQYIILYSAKIGSGFATNGWIMFNQNLDNPSGAPSASLIGTPPAPDVSSLVTFMSVVQACKAAYAMNEGIEISAYVHHMDDRTEISGPASSGPFTALRTAHPQGEINVTFGREENLPSGGSHLKPYCGSVRIPTNFAQASSVAQLESDYFIAVDSLWRNEYLQFIGERIALAHHTFDVSDPSLLSAGMSANSEACDVTAPVPAALPEGGFAPAPSEPDNCAENYLPPSSYKTWIVSEMNSFIENRVAEFINTQRQSVTLDIVPEVIERGWGGAGIWYSTIAEINGAYAVAALNFPEQRNLPLVMQEVLDRKNEAEDSVTTCKMFEPNLPENQLMRFSGGQTSKYYALVMDDAYQYWSCDRTNVANNVIENTIAAIFGLGGLFSVRDTETYTAPDGSTQIISVHPLTKLSLIGKGLVESSIRSLTIAMGMSVVGGMTGILGGFAQAAQAASGFFVSIATIGMSVGFILFYILPFLPFIYFFFAVGAWVKSIFEAMCAAPLWAISHLRIDGEGIPGKSALNGYQLIFEIFLRPILTIFGLVGGMATFVALAMMLNELFDLVVVGVTGNDAANAGPGEVAYIRGFIDDFFFTIVYAVILYMMAIASFKMINLVPNNILRWLGSSASAFSDNTQDPTQGLSQYAALGAARIGGPIAGGFSQLGQAGGSLTNVLTTGRVN